MAYNILVVDDSAVVRAVIKKTLTLAGIDVGQIFNAENGQVGLDIAATEWIDLIFADINMPIMGGIEMVERMSEEGLLSTIPIIIVSTEGSATRIAELKKKGVAAYVRKPFTPESIREVVTQVMGDQNGQ